MSRRRLTSAWKLLVSWVMIAVACWQERAEHMWRNHALGKTIGVACRTLCGGGPGATDFSSGPDASGNVALALQDWVEKGAKPERILAVHRQNRQPDAAISFSRPLCAWPKTAHYSGAGSTDDAANFTCQ